MARLSFVRIYSYSSIGYTLDLNPKTPQDLFQNALRVRLLGTERSYYRTCCFQSYSLPTQA